MNKDEIFKVVQTYLDKPPLVIWGSGATIDFGLPSMSQLKDEIDRSVPIFDKNRCKRMSKEKMMKPALLKQYPGRSIIVSLLRVMWQPARCPNILSFLKKEF